MTNRNKNSQDSEKNVPDHLKAIIPNYLVRETWERIQETGTDVWISDIDEMSIDQSITALTRIKTISDEMGKERDKDTYLPVWYDFQLHKVDGGDGYYLWGKRKETSTECRARLKKEYEDKLEEDRKVAASREAEQAIKNLAKEHGINVEIKPKSRW